MVIRSASPAAVDVGPRTDDRIRLELDADQLEPGEPAGHRDQPATAAAMHVHHAPAAGQVGDQLRQRGECLLEEDRDVLRGQPLDGDPVAIGPVADRLRRSGRSRPSLPSRARRPWRGRTGRRGSRAGPRRAGSTATSSSTRSRSPSSVTRSCASAAHAQASIACGTQPASVASSPTAMPSRPGLPDPPEQAELEAEVDQPRAVEAAEGRDEVVEAIVEGHRRAIVAWPIAPPACRPGYGTVPSRTRLQRSWRPRGSGGRWIPTARSSRPWRPTSTDRSRRSCWRTRTGSTRSHCGSWATRATPRRPRRTPSSGRTGRSAATTRRGSATSDSGRGWRRSSSTCAARD